MKLMTGICDGKPRVGLWMGQQEVRWHKDHAINMVGLIGTMGARVGDDAFETQSSTFEQWLPPVSPEKVICIGRNYAEHAKEMGGEAPELPVIFNKFPSSICAHQSEIVLPPISEKVDWEAELVVVIGRGGRSISQQEALNHVFGYTCGNDISARDWQKGKPGGQWLLGKTFDTFAPTGPTIVTADEIEDAHQLDISLRLNGQVMQNSNTRNFIFSIDMLIAHLSKFVTLAPGDLIFTGTPAGVGAGRTPPMFLKDGDHLQVEIGGVGLLENWVVQGS